MTREEVMEIVEREDVKFIRLAYFDVRGVQHNVSIMPNRLQRAFEKGIAVDCACVPGFGEEAESDLYLIPDPETMTFLPWRSAETGVIHMVCSLYRPDGRLFEQDSRQILKKAIEHAWQADLDLMMAAKFEFYLFRLDENGNPTRIPFDQGGYMDVAPLDRGENVRRAICLTLDEMGLDPQKSFHQEGPGQNEIDFHFNEPLRAADEASIFKWVVRTSANANGLYGDFSPKPLKDQPGSGLHIQIHLHDVVREVRVSFIAGILKYVREATLFFNPSRESYERLGRDRAPGCAAWSDTLRNVMVRIPGRSPDVVELRTADCLANPYLAFALMIEAGLRGIRESLKLPKPWQTGHAEPCPRLPRSVEQARELATDSQFVHDVLPSEIIDWYLKGQER